MYFVNKKYCQVENLSHVTRCNLNVAIVIISNNINYKLGTCVRFVLQTPQCTMERRVYYQGTDTGSSVIGTIFLLVQSCGMQSLIFYYFSYVSSFIDAQLSLTVRH